MKRVLLLTVLVVLALTGPAGAESAEEVAATLRSSPVHQDRGVDLVDVATLTSELTGSNPSVKVAVLSASAASSAAQADARATEIGRALGDSDVVVLVITASRKLGAGEGSGAADRGVDADAALAAELKETEGQAFTKDNLTAFVTSFAQRIAEQASGGSSSGRTSSKGGGNGGLYLLVGLGVLGAGGVALAARSSRKRRKDSNEAERADVEQLYNRLGSDVSTLDPKDDAIARQALVDASERYNACGSAMASADAPAEWAAARRAAIEGLTAARTARERLGLDLGPPIPVVAPASGPQLTSDQQVVLAGQAYDGSPSYQPGRQHYYGGGDIGGQRVAGGWYSAPFWEPFLLGAILTGGLGGLGGGGFERGYEAGQDDAQGGQGDGGGSGGDWGGSGGDSGGGGDW